MGAANTRWPSIQRLMPTRGSTPLARLELAGPHEGSWPSGRRASQKMVSKRGPRTGGVFRARRTEPVRAEAPAALARTGHEPHRARQHAVAVGSSAGAPGGGPSRPTSTPSSSTASRIAPRAHHAPLALDRHPRAAARRPRRGLAAGEGVEAGHHGDRLAALDPVVSRPCAPSRIRTTVAASREPRLAGLAHGWCARSPRHRPARRALEQPERLVDLGGGDVSGGRKPHAARAARSSYHAQFVERGR